MRQTSIIQSISKYAILSGCVSLVSMISTVLIYRLMGPNETGHLVIVLGLVQTVAPLASFGTADALQRFVVNAPHYLAMRLYRRAFLFIMLGLLVVFGLACVPAFNSRLPNEVQSVLWLVFTVITALAFHTLNLWMLRGLGRLNMVPLLSGVGDIGPRLVMLVLLVLGTGTYQSYLFAQLVFYLVAMAVGGFIVIRLLRSDLPKVEPVESLSSERGYWFFVGQALLGTGLLYIGGYFVPLVIRYYLTPRDVGLYAVASRLPSVLQGLFLIPLSAPLVYHLTAEVDRTRRARLVQRGTGLLALGFGVACLILAGTAHWVVLFLFGQEFQDAIPAYQVYAFYPFVMALQAGLNPLSVSLNRLHVANSTGMVVMMLLIAGLPFIIPAYGILGASLVVVGANVASANFLFAFWMRDAVPGMWRSFAVIWLIYLPWIVLAITPFWVLGLGGFPLLLFVFRIVQFKDVKVVLYQVASPICAKTQKLGQGVR